MQGGAGAHSTPIDWYDEDSLRLAREAYSCYS